MSDNPKKPQSIVGRTAVFFKKSELLAELTAKSLKELKVIAKCIPVPHSGKSKSDLINDLLGIGRRQRLLAILGPLRESQPRELVITTGDPNKPKRQIVCFFSTFGGIWLLLEPISAFTTGARVLSHAGWWGYLLLVIASMVTAGVLESRHEMHRFEKFVFISFFLIFPKSGRQILIRVPRDMQIETFLRLLLTKIGFSSLMPVECTGIHFYTHNLMIKTPRGFKPVDSNLTFEEAHITDGTICRLRGYIRAEYTLPLMDIEYSWQPARLELARAGGLVLLDEKDSIAYEDAKAQGLLSEAVIARAERFRHKHEGETFVVLCPAGEIDDVPELATRGEIP